MRKQPGFGQFRNLSTPLQHPKTRNCGRLEFHSRGTSGGPNNRARCAHRAHCPSFSKRHSTPACGVSLCCRCAAATRGRPARCQRRPRAFAHSLTVSPTSSAVGVHPETQPVPLRHSSAVLASPFDDRLRPAARLFENFDSFKPMTCTVRHT